MKLVALAGLLIPFAVLARAQYNGLGGGNPVSDTSATSVSNRDRSIHPIDMEAVQRPVDLSGRVVLSSGGAPPDPVRIKRVCGPRTTVEGFTDSKGRFSFRVGANAALTIMDAGYSGPTQGADRTISAVSVNSVRVAPLAGCTLEVEAPGYSSNSIMLDRRDTGDNPDVGTFILTPVDGSETSGVSATSLAAPPRARSSFEKALDELSKGRFSKPDKAIRHLEEALTLYPEYAAAWSILGQVRSQQGDAEAAVNALEKALQADSRYLSPYGPLAQLMIAAGKWERALELADFVLSVNPANVQMRWYRAISQFEMKRQDEAIASLTELQSDEAGEQQYPQSHHVLGRIYAGRGQFPEAAVEYRRFLELSPKAGISDKVRRLLYEWEQLGVI